MYETSSSYNLRKFLKEIGYKMPIITLNSKFKLPDVNNFFQVVMYNTLAHYKEEFLQIETPKDNYAIFLPKDEWEKNILIDYRNDVKEYFDNHPITRHRFFNHLASSQAACFNLFMPFRKDNLLADHVFREIIPDYYSLDSIEFEYYHKDDLLGEGRNKNKGANVGTDVDAAIFYYDTHGNKNVCFVEHKLTEHKFSYCNTIKNKAQNKEFCESFEYIGMGKNCYYQFGKEYKYWELTQESNSFFDIEALKNISETCPFKYSLQQLWRNMLLAQAMENNKIVNKAYFAVVYHEHNKQLWRMDSKEGFLDIYEMFRSLLCRKDRFFRFTIQDVINRVKIHSTSNKWINEYEKKYLLMRYD